MAYACDSFDRNYKMLLLWYKNLIADSLLLTELKERA